MNYQALAGSLVAALMLGACSTEVPSTLSFNPESSSESSEQLRSPIEPAPNRQSLGIAVVESLTLLVQPTLPARYSVVAQGQISCGSTLLDPRIRERDRRIAITLLTVDDPTIFCIQPFSDFSETIPLGPLSRGVYRIRVNGVTETFRIP